MEPKPDVPIRASGRTLAILEALATMENAGVSALAAELDMAKGTVHHHLKTLEAYEFVVNKNGEYQISLRFLDFGEQARGRVNLYQIAQPEVEELAEKTGETAYLMVPEHGQGVILYKTKGEQAQQTELEVGMRVPLSQSAPGKAILAISNENPDKTYIETEKTKIQSKEFAEELEFIRQNGYTVDSEEWREGLQSVASPIHLEDEKTVGAVGTMVPSHKLDPDDIDHSLVDAITSASRLIEIKGSYS